MIKRGISAVVEWIGVLVAACLLAFAFVMLFFGYGELSFVAMMILLVMVFSDGSIRRD